MTRKSSRAPRNLPITLWQGAVQWNGMSHLAGDTQSDSKLAWAEGSAVKRRGVTGLQSGCLSGFKPCDIQHVTSQLWER